MTGNATEDEPEPRDWPELDPDHVLSSRQLKILQVIAGFMGRRGHSPTLREIAQAAGLASASGVSYQLATLESKGYLRRDPRRPRTVEVRPPDQSAVRVEMVERGDAADISHDSGYVPVPLFGQIAAGSPNLAEQEVEDTFVLPKQLVGGGSLFLLRVHGDSMINAAITDGDLVVVRYQWKAENGEIVAAMVDGEATLKTFQQQKRRVWLMPNNPAYAPIPGNDATILGKVVAVLRRL